MYMSPMIQLRQKLVKMLVLENPDDVTWAEGYIIDIEGNSSSAGLPTTPDKHNQELRWKSPGAACCSARTISSTDAFSDDLMNEVCSVCWSHSAYPKALQLLRMVLMSY